MFKEVKIKNLNKTDRVFQSGKTLVKVRLLSREVHANNKLSGPAAISFQLSASVCDKEGKAIPDKNGRFAILPHTLTLPLMEMGQNEAEIKQRLEKVIEPLIEKATLWHRTKNAAEKAIKAWENT